MPELEINDIATKGVTRDEPAYQLPPELWTQALNMRARDNGMVRMEGWSQVLGTPGVAPHFAMSVVTQATAFWLYTSLTKAYGYDGATHTDLTRVSGGNYTTAETRDWNGTLFGGIPILNNGADVPQMWSTVSLGTPLTPLSNWTAGMKAKVLRSFGPYLIAANVTKSGSSYPHMVKWSAEALQPGSPPSSWDETDDTKDAGEYDLYDVNSGLLVDMMNLAGKMYLYKEQSTWVMRFVGGRAVFAIEPLYETLGILAPRCVIVTGDGKNQVVATQDDLIIHNGGEPVSILNHRLRKEIFSQIDSSNYVNSFLYVDPENNEVVFAYPTTGMVYATRGVVFNYKTGTITEIDGITYRNAASGRLQSVSSELWSEGTDTWEDDTGAWDTQERRRTILCGTDDTMFFKLNDGTTRNGTSYTGTLQRTGLSLVGRKRTGEWIVNHEIEKMIDRLWPKIKNGSVRIRIGAAETVDGTVTWGDYITFDPTTGVFADADPPISGRAVAVEFSASNDFRLDGYRINVIPLGNF